MKGGKSKPSHLKPLKIKQKEPSCEGVNVFWGNKKRIKDMSPSERLRATMFHHHPCLLHPWQGNPGTDGEDVVSDHYSCVEILVYQ